MVHSRMSRDQGLFISPEVHVGKPFGAEVQISSPGGLQAFDRQIHVVLYIYSPLQDISRREPYLKAQVLHFRALNSCRTYKPWNFYFYILTSSAPGAITYNPVIMLNSYCRVGDRCTCDAIS